MSAQIVVGIIGGGQLGMMLIQYGIQRLVPFARICVLDPCLECSCSTLSGVKIVQGNLTDETDLRSFCRACDVVTWEIEHIDIDVLLALKAEGVKFIPDPEVLAIIQNKGTQKVFYQERNIPTAPFYITNSPSLQWKEGGSWDCDTFTQDKVVYKDATGGYDGHGVQVVSSTDKTCVDPDTIVDRVVVVEPFVCDPKVEISVIITRTPDGFYFTYEPVQMTFHAFRNILAQCFPASLPPEIEEKARIIAQDVARELGSPGLYAVEMFYLPQSGEVWVNETAPRVHNSGHHTIHSHNISQFEMLARLLLSVPCEQPVMHSTYVMRNILGNADPTTEGAYRIRNKAVFWDHDDEGPWLIDYRKDVARPWRKLGHLTLIRRLETVDDHNSADLCYDMETIYYPAIVVETPDTPIHVGVVMGSQTDWPFMKEACNVLNGLGGGHDDGGVGYETTVVSAHRTPDRLVQYAKSARQRGLKVIIAGAGGAAHLPGMLAAHTTVPIIGVPIASDRNKLGGQDSLYSIVQMPPGVPVACMAINGARNAGIFALQILGEHETLDRMRRVARQKVIRDAILQ